MLARSLALLSLVAATTAAPALAQRALLQLDKDWIAAQVQTQDADVRPAEHGLRVATGHRQPWPGITIRVPQGRWDLSPYTEVLLDVKNVGQDAVEVCLRIDNPGADGVQHCVTGRVALEPGQGKTLRMPLACKPLFGMRGYPEGYGEKSSIDPARVNQVIVFLAKPRADHVFEITGLRAAGSAEKVKAEEKTFFPLIDTFGQYVHKDWPGKTHSLEELRQHGQREASDLATHPGPAGWDQYGGWKAGPPLKATGRFRTEQRKGKWWLVDPEGRLFWSHGVDCVDAATGVTPITDRRDWFADLPSPDSPLAQFLGRGDWAPHGYYQGRSYETFNFTGANLLRKYGDSWMGQFRQLAHQRLRSWGMNTIANWSDEEICRLDKTPYTASLHGGGRQLEGSSGYWGKFADVFDPSFHTSLLASAARQKRRSAGDPWCLGCFVDNELSWGDDLSLALASLASPPDQPAKRAMVEDLRRKYASIERLNEAWGTSHASWDALLAATVPPDPRRAHDDLAAFATRFAEQYFRLCREAVKQVDPQLLYLGCRFAWTNDRAVRAAAAYCDVISFNRYQRSVAELRLPEGVDKPAIIGEFHFGALDRGMFHTGLVPTDSQPQRARAYRQYVGGALQNAWLVGTHWFQFGDQATTGRGDGENYQIGLVDVCDTPYPETIAALREIGTILYTARDGRQ
jgi:hypothetical protein